MTSFWSRRNRPAAPARSRLLLERLEDRTVLNNTYHSLAGGNFSQNWTNTGMIAADNDWGGVPSIIGYRGQGLSSPAPDGDPYYITAPGLGASDVHVRANQTALGGVVDGLTELQLADPVVALRPSTASPQYAPHLLLHLNTQNVRNVRVSFDLRDLDASSSGTATFAVQYRIGTSGNFNPVDTGGWVFSANEAGDTTVTAVSATLPGQVDDQAQVQVRIITAQRGAPVVVGVDNLLVQSTPVPSPQRVVFDIDQAASTRLNVAGRARVNGGSWSNLNQQGTNSLASLVTGSVAANIGWANNTIQFLENGTAADATVTGNWSPGINGVSGTAPADYGGRVRLTLGFLSIDADIALRDVVATMFNASPVALSGSGASRSFPSTQTLKIAAGNADYRTSGFLTTSGRESIANNSAANTTPTAGSLEDMGGGVYRLTSPVRVVITEQITSSGFTVDVELTISGTLVSMARLPVADLNGSDIAGGNDVTASFTEDAGATPITPDATLTRTPAANLTRATIVLTNRPDGNAESLAITAAGLTSSGYNPATGTLTLTGSASLATYQAALQTLTYNNTSQNPSGANRLVEITLNDGTNDSRTSTSIVVVTAVNDAPTHTVPGDIQFVAAGSDLVFSEANGNPISVADVDAGSSPIYMEIFLSTYGLPTVGSFSLSTTAGLTFLQGDGANDDWMIFVGSQAAINAALAGLTYRNGAGFVNDYDALFFFTVDLGASGTGGQQYALDAVFMYVYGE